MFSPIWPWIEIFSSGLMVLFGTYLWTRAWESKDPYTGLRLKLIVGFAAVLLIFGGIIGTKGWNDLSEAERGRALVAMLGEDLTTNYRILHEDNLATTDEEKLKSVTVYVRPQRDLIAAALGSLVLAGIEHRELRLGLRRLSLTLTQLDVLMGYTEERLSAVSLIPPKPEDWAGWRRIIRDTPPRKLSIAEIEKLLDILRQPYGVPIPPNDVLLQK
jgi:hypothetical protein